MCPLTCPQCNCENLFRDGLRTLNSGEKVQRWLCRSCGYRFSEKIIEMMPQENQRGTINSYVGINTNNQICALEAKNLETAVNEKAAGVSPEAKGQMSNMPSGCKKKATPKQQSHVESDSLQHLLNAELTYRIPNQ